MSFIQQFFTSRDNNANASTFVGQEGRLWWDPITNKLYYSDGSTPGGIPVGGGGGGNGTPGGSNTQVQFNQSGNFGGSANLTFNYLTGLLTSVSFAGDGSALANITGANVTGIVANATHANIADSANSVAGANVTGTVGNAAHAVVSDSANSVAGANVTGTVANATYAGSSGTAVAVTGNAQPNITSVGTLTSITSTGNITTTGNITGNYYFGNGSQLTGIVATSANTANTANTAITVTGNAQPNITSVGTLTSLTSTGNITTSGNLTANYLIASGGNTVINSEISTTGNIIASYYFGDGTYLTGLTPVAQQYLFSPDVSTVSPYYQAKYLTNYNTNEAYANTVVSVSTSPALLVEFLTNANYPGIRAIPPGQILCQIETQKTSGVKFYSVYFELWKYSNGGTETKLLTSDIFQTATNILVQQNISATNINTISLQSSDRLAVKFYGYTSNGNDTITTTWGDTTNTGLNLPVPAATISQFVPYQYATANVDLGNHGLWASGEVDTGHQSATFGLKSGAFDYANSIVQVTANNPATADMVLQNINSTGTGRFTINNNAGNTNIGNFTAVGMLGTNASAVGPLYAGDGYLTVVKNLANVNQFGGNLVIGSYNGYTKIVVGANTTIANINTAGVNITGNLSASGNVIGNYIVGNGSALTSITGANVTGNVANATYALSANSASSLVNGASSVILNSDGTMTFPSNVINSNANPITLWSTNSSKLLWRDSAGGAPGQPVQTTITAGNGSATITVATGVLAVQSQKTWTFNTAGNIVFPDATVQTTAYPGTANTMSVIGNITGGNILTGGLISATGNLTSGNLTTTTANFATFNSSVGGNVIGTLVSTSANAQFINQTNAEGYATVAGFLSVAGNVTGGNILTGGLISATGNATAGNVSTAGLITATGNIIVGNVNTAGRVSATGNLLGGNLTTTGAVYSNYNTNTANTGSFMATGGNTKGGTGYLDFLVVQNTSGGATNPYKWLRTTSDGQLQIINSTYATNIFNLTDAGALTVPGPIYIGSKQAVNGPAFSAYAAAILQNIPNGTQTKVLFQTEEFDTNNNYASSRFTPTVEGYYQLNAEVRLDGASGTGEMMIVLYKNGAEYKRGWNQSGTQIAGSFWAMTVSSLAYANGSTDYFEIYVQQGSGGTISVTAVNAPAITWFNGCMLRGA